MDGRHGRCDTWTVGGRTSPSGVSDGQSMPHWLGWSDRGPETLRVFSNWDMMRVIMPSAEIYESRESTYRVRKVVAT